MTENPIVAELDAEHRARRSRMGDRLSKPPAHTVISTAQGSCLIGPISYMGSVRPTGEPWSVSDTRREAIRLSLLASALEGSLCPRKEGLIRVIVGGEKTAHQRTMPMLVLESACLVHDVTIEDILSESREGGGLREARRSAAKHMRARLGLTGERIGELLGRAPRTAHDLFGHHRVSRWDARDHALTWAVTVARSAVNQDLWPA